MSLKNLPAFAVSALAFVVPFDVHAEGVNGKEIYMNVCADCHGAGPAEEHAEDRIAPPIFAAKNHYSDFTERQDFIDAVGAFIFAPTEAAAQMPGAVKKFGLMPEVGLSEAEAAEVAAYLFDTDFAAPEWYLEHYKAEHGETPKGME